jgi:hypothetical protein
MYGHIGHPGQATTSAATAPRDPDATIGGRLVNLREAIEHAHALAGSAENIADRICGNRQDKDVGAKPSPVPNGLYEEFGVALENLHAALDRIDFALRCTVGTLG